LETHALLALMGRDMSQGQLPEIRGSDWRASEPLVFSNPLPADAARSEILRFVAERHDGHLQLVATVWDFVNDGETSFDGESWHEFSNRLLEALGQGLTGRLNIEGLSDGEIIPRREKELYLDRRGKRFLIDISLSLRRLAQYMAITIELRTEWQRMMTRTRKLDEQLKDIFVNGMDTPDGGKFGGKGFRSTWQEGCVAAGTALNRFPDNPKGSEYEGDFVAPMIRDIGLCMAMGDTPRDLMTAQMGKSESVMDGGHDGAGGRDLHVGCFHRGVLPPTAPLPIASVTMTGMALSAMLKGQERFHVACIGEGSSSSGEWWEALNFASTRGLPITYILQNNQIALDTPPVNQSNVEVWADKGVAMGMPSWTIDGSDPAAWHASVATAREFSLSGGGPTLIHVETMRGCGHAHHHDDLYLGSPSGTPPGYVDQELLSYWEAKDPIKSHRQLLLELGVEESELESMEVEEQELVDQARSDVEEMDWADPSTVTVGITSLHDADTHQDHLNRLSGGTEVDMSAVLQVGECLLNYEESGGWTYSRAIQQAMCDIAEMYGEETVFMGEDMEVAGAFGMNIPLKANGHQDKLLDMPLCEAAIIHSATGAALAGMRPMAEIQFGGFAALAHNALVNNASMLRWRWGAKVPLTVRIPLGARTRSGPFHANMIESWYANDPGLVVVAPGTPQDAYDLLMESAALDDPVVFLEHIGLYGLRGGLTGWSQNINQAVDTSTVNGFIENQERYKIGKAGVVRGGEHVTLVTWGAMLHIAKLAADQLSEEGIEVEIIDVRTLIPFDSGTCVSSVMRTGRLVILQEGQWFGGLGHSMQSRILEETFYNLESPPIVIGALDTPVPFAPPLENHTVPSLEHVTETLRKIVQN
ncbi:MAG: thiamine pyrophosphate-dependent enzyme, partial [Candidatus Poseidoniaceae archaeon]|nr:thiamine pyrophosphate-dependent enzyme [Candidatus Poseidoniaceae archaeon]